MMKTCQVCNITYEKEITDFQYPKLMNNRILEYTDYNLVKLIKVVQGIYSFELSSSHTIEEAENYYASKYGIDKKLYSLMQKIQLVDDSRGSPLNTLAHLLIIRFLGHSTHCRGCVLSLTNLIKKCKVDSYEELEIMMIELVQILVKKELKKRRIK